MPGIESHTTNRKWFRGWETFGLRHVREATSHQWQRLGGWAGLGTKAGTFLQTVKERMPRSPEDFRRQTEEGIERARQFFSGKAYGTYLRLGAAAFAAYFMADTVSLFTDALVPEPPNVPAPRMAQRTQQRGSEDDYSSILSRNIFNSQNLIPEDDSQLASGPARKTSLPLNLVGTVVLRDELKSIAAIEDKSQSMVFPLRVDDTLSGKIQVTKIEHLRVTFINKSTGALEYIEIEEDFPMPNIGAARAAPSRPAGTGITQSDEQNFDIEKTTVDKTLANLPQVLQQARAIPNFENGIPDGYKILQIVPGSIYDQLGIKNGDVITSINGDPINDPGKAFQMFNELKNNARHLEIGIKRGGRKTVQNYNIR